MKRNKLIVSVAVLTLMLTAGATSVFAYQGDYTQKGPIDSPERHEAMEEAFANNDYNAWKELMNGRGRVKEVINSDNFAQFAEAHNLAEAGKYDEADEIRKELGLRAKDDKQVGAGYGRGNGQKSGQRRGNCGDNSDN